MATKSDNTQGNPWHDEEGKFTSKDGESGQKLSVSSGEILNRIENIQNQGQQGQTIKPKFKIKSDASKILGQLSSMNEVSKIPVLQSAQDIYENIERFFSKATIEKIDQFFGKTPDCSPWQFHPKSAPNVSLPIFPCIIGKYRYKDNHARLVSREEFNQLIANDQYNSIVRNYYQSAYGSSRTAKQVLSLQPVFRGITARNRQDLSNIIDSYVVMDYNNFDYYGGGCYGSNVYTSVDKHYSESYASSYRGYGHMIYGILDTRGARYLNDDNLQSIQYMLRGYNLSSRIEKHLIQNGMEENRANQIAKSFEYCARNDLGMCGILLGLDFSVSEDHQRNIYNLARWNIRKDFI